MTIGDTWIATSCLAADLTSGDGDRSQVIREAILAAWQARRDEQVRAEAEAVGQ